MHAFPHRYAIEAQATPEGDVVLRGGSLPPLDTQPPLEFGGPGDRWSPETLLVGAVGDCFVLGFRAIAAASKLEWSRLRCEVAGVLDRVDGRTRFTELAIEAWLALPAASDEARAQRLLEKAEQACLITNSLSAEVSLTCHLEAE